MSTMFDRRLFDRVFKQRIVLVTISDPGGDSVEHEALPFNTIIALVGVKTTTLAIMIKRTHPLLDFSS